MYLPAFSESKFIDSSGLESWSFVGWVPVTVVVFFVVRKPRLIVELVRVDGEKKEQERR